MNTAGPIVVVMGVSGCGKSTVGQELARQTGLEFADGDDFHSAGDITKMHSGHALDDADRRLSLDNVDGWLSQQTTGVVLACSALKRIYRDQLRTVAPSAFFLHLAGSRDEACRRVSQRRGHFMPASLVYSQYDALEPLGADERGLTVDFTQDAQAIVEKAIEQFGLRRAGTAGADS